MITKEEWIDYLSEHEKEIKELASSDRPVLWIDLEKNPVLKAKVEENPFDSVMNAVETLRTEFAELHNLSYPPEIAFSAEPTKLVGDFKFEKMGDLICYKGQITEILNTPDDLFEARFDGCMCEEADFKWIDPPKKFKETAKCKRCKKICYFNPDISIYCPSSYFVFSGTQDEANDSGMLPTIYVRADGVMTDNVIPGKHAIITGVKRPPKKGEYMAYVHASSVRLLDDADFEKTITEEDKKYFKSFANRHKDNIMEVLAESAFGDWASWDKVKEFLVMNLIEGHVGQIETETISPRIHIALIGSVGVAKTAMMRRVVQLSPNGQFADCGLSSAVGLTASIDVSRKTKQRMIKPGKAVLADRGHLAIDDAQQMDDDEKEVLLGVMENGEVDVSKVVMAKFNARCSLSFGLNPLSGVWDKTNMNIQEQTGFSAAFLSRCDVLCLMLDKPDKETDTEIVESLTRKLRGESKKNGMSEMMLRKYLFVASKIETYLTKEAEEELKNYYVQVRQQSQGRIDGALPITPRQYRTLWKFATAIAKARLDPVTTVKDIRKAIAYYKSILGSFTQFQDKLFDDASILYGDGGISAKAMLFELEKIMKNSNDPMSVEDILVMKPYFNEENVKSMLKTLKKQRKIFEPKTDKWKWL